jgi:putative mycofactocin binding protein MftB
MGCAASTDPGSTATGQAADPAAPAFILDSPWQVHPQVSVRPEKFGALLYHFGTRRLSFLKSPALLAVVRALGEAPTARQACAEAGVGQADLPAYAAALGTLAQSRMICPRPDASAPDASGRAS